MSPVWLPSLQQASDIAGLALPILGVTWLLVQIVGHFWKVYKQWKAKKNAV